MCVLLSQLNCTEFTETQKDRNEKEMGQPEESKED